MKSILGYGHHAISVDARARVTGLETPMTWFFATKINGERPKGAPPS
jgi:hypothetical protein